MDPRVEANLRGQVIHKPKEQIWMLKMDSANEEYKYTCESGHTKWSPMNSNLQMQGIKVKENRPIPEATINKLANSHEDTLLLLELIRQKKAKENRQKKDAMIRAMALEQKETLEASRHPQYCQLTWNSGGI